MHRRPREIGRRIVQCRILTFLVPEQFIADYRSIAKRKWSNSRTAWANGNHRDCGVRQMALVGSHKKLYKCQFYSDTPQVMQYAKMFIGVCVPNLMFYQMGWSHWHILSILECKQNDHSAATFYFMRNIHCALRMVHNKHVSISARQLIRACAFNTRSRGCIEQCGTIGAFVWRWVNRGIAIQVKPDRTLLSYINIWVYRENRQRKNNRLNTEYVGISGTFQSAMPMAKFTHTLANT